MARAAAFLPAAPLTPRTARARSRRTRHAPAMSVPGAGAATRLALCQMAVGASKAANIAAARAALRRAAAGGAAVAVLPECWNAPYDTAQFRAYAEPVPPVGGAAAAGATAGSAPSVAMLRETAAELGMVVVGGSIPEAGADGAVYNTAVVVGADGGVLAVHRKVHLFDVDCSATGGIVFAESDTLSAGGALTTFAAAPRLTAGLGVCYDIRFPDMALALARGGGAKLLLYPGAFNMTTGPAHWELLARARAVDTQCYVAVCSPARVDGAPGYRPWGHSMVVDPWGEVLVAAAAGEDVVFADVCVDRVDQVRSMIPTGKQRRPDVYDVKGV